GNVWAFHPAHSHSSKGSFAATVGGSWWAQMMRWGPNFEPSIGWKTSTRMAWSLGTFWRTQSNICSISACMPQSRTSQAASGGTITGTCGFMSSSPCWRCRSGEGSPDGGDRGRSAGRVGLDLVQQVDDHLGEGAHLGHAGVVGKRPTDSDSEEGV